MSVKTFLTKLFGGLKKFFDKGLTQAQKNALHIGCTIVENIKNLAESPVADVMTAIIPGEWDDKVKQLLRQHLPTILVEMKLVENCANQTDPAEIIKCAANTLQQLTGDWVKDSARKNFLDSIAVLVAQLAADGKFDWDDIKVLTKWYKDHMFKPAK